MSRELDEWRRRTAAAGLDVAQVEAAARRRRGLPQLSAEESASAYGGRSAAAAGSSGSVPRPRRGDQRPRPDRASAEGLADSSSGVWNRLRSIAESDLGDDEKRELYATAGVDENQVARVLAQIELGEAVEDEPVQVSDMAGMLERRFGPPTNDAQRAYIEQYRRQDEAANAAATERRDAEIAARLDEQQAEFSREEPWWMKVLLTLDKPRAVLVAGLSQLDAATDDDGSTVASWDRFAEQVGDNITFSELIDEDAMPGWARFALGFGVDVLLDPLTYLTGGSAAVAKVAGKGGLKLAGIVQDASDIARVAGNVEDADKFRRLVGRIGDVGGFGGLSKADRELAEQAAKLTRAIDPNASLRGGVYFRLPGMEGFRLPGVSELLTPVSRQVARRTVDLRKTKFWSVTAHPWSTERREFLQQFQTAGTLDDKWNALTAYRASTVADLSAAKLVEGLQSNRVALLSQGRKLGVDPSDIHHYLGAPTALRPDGSVNPIATRLAEEGADGPTGQLMARWQQWWASAAANFNREAGVDLIRPLGSNYTFHLRLQAFGEGEDAFEAAARAASSGGGVPSAPEMYRTIEPGRTFQGVQIVEPEDSARLFNNDPQFAGLAPEQQALEILRRQGRAAEVDALFSDDYVGYTQLYVNMLGRRLRNVKFGRVLEESAVGLSRQSFDVLGRVSAGQVVDRYSLILRDRFGAQVADRRATQAALAGALGVEMPRSLTAEYADVVRALARSLQPDGGEVADVRALLGQFDSVLDGQVAKVEGLAGSAMTRLQQFAGEVEQSFRRFDPEEAFDLFTTGISNRTAPTLQALEGTIDELSVVAAGLDSRLLGEVEGELAALRTLVSDELVKVQTTVDAMAGRNLASEIAQRQVLDQDLARLTDTLNAVELVSSRVGRLRSVEQRVERALRGSRDGLSGVERGLVAGSDGVARLGNGRVARLTRVQGDVGAGAVDRVGVRFTFADDVDAADARFLGDVAGTRTTGDTVQVPRVVVPDMPEFYGVQREINGFGNPEWRRMTDAGREYGQAIRGTPISPDDQRIPDMLFHVTTRGAAVDADGILRARGSGGLGGDARDRIVSLTASREVADQLVDDMTLMARIAQTDDSETVLNLLVSDLNKYGISPSPAGLDNYRRTLETSGKSVLADVHFYARNSNGGPQNPLFFGMDDDLTYWRNTSIADIRVVEVPKRNIATGAMVTDFDLGRNFLEEIRVYGDVPIARVRPRPNREAPQRLFSFQTNVSSPLTFTGRTAGTQLNADLAMHGVRTGQINLKAVTVTPENVGNIGDILLWNRMVGVISDATRSRVTTPSDLVDTLNRVVRDYAALDPQSFAARVAASSENPADMLLDAIVNRNALSSTDRAQLGLWDDLLDGVKVDGNKLGRSYANDLSRRGFDGALLDDGTTRELVSFRPQSMIPQNPQSRILLRLQDEQVRVRKRVVALREKMDGSVKSMGFDPELLHTSPQAWRAAQAKSGKRLGVLSRRKTRSPREENELLLRRDAAKIFGDADRLDGQADELQKAFDDEYLRGVRRAEAAGLPAAPQGAPPARIAELRSEASMLRILAQADAADADLMARGVDAGYDMLFTGKLATDQELAANLATMLRQGMTGLNDMSLAPEAIARVSADAAKSMQAVEVRKLLRAFDYLTGVFKSYAVMSPGFINRNFVGAVMNNWLGLVNLKSYNEFFKADKIFRRAVDAGRTVDQALDDVAAGFGKRGAKARDAYESWLDLAPGMSGGMAASWASDVGVASVDAVANQGIGAAARGMGWTSQGLRDNTATRAFFYMNTRAEYRVRGVMAWDEVFRKSGDVGSAANRVWQFHFDYSPSGLSRVERNVFRRVIPFYVWTANNIPLQLKGLVTRPKVAASYLKFKQNMEELSEDEGVVPEYFGRLAGIRLPFTNDDGHHIYFMPDLPFRDLGMLGSIKPTLNPIEFVANLVDMDEVKSSVNPLLRTPAETLVANEKFFTGAPFRDGYVPMGLLGRIPGLGPALGALGQARQDANGEWMVGEKQLYAIEQFQPLLGRISRLFPQDAKGREKQWSAWLSTFVGVGFRTNTFTEQSNQLFRLQDRLDTAIRSQETLGRQFPTATEIRRSQETDRQVERLGGYSDETDFLLQILNSGDVEAIADLDGFGDESAATIAGSVAQSGRFSDVRDLLTARDVSASGVERAVESLRARREFTLDPLTAGVDELVAMPNIGEKTAAKILALRNSGGLVSLDSLRQVGLSRRQINEIAQWIEGERLFQAQMAGVL